MITVPLVYFIIAVCFIFMSGTKAGHMENRKAAAFYERQRQQNLAVEIGGDLPDYQ